MSLTFLRHVLVVQGLLLAVALGLFFAHGLWLAWYNRRSRPLLERAEAIVAVLLGGAPLAQTERAWLSALPVRLQIRLFVHLAPSLSGAQKQQLAALAQTLGLLTRAVRRCRSQRWWRRLQGARLLTLLGGGEDVLPALFWDRQDLVRAQAAELAAACPTPAVLEALLTQLGDADSLCRFTAQDTLLRLGSLAAGPLEQILSLPSAPQVEAALVVAVGLADARCLRPALTLCHSAAPNVRALAATLLGALGGREGVEVLTTLLDDSIPEVRAAAAQALGTLHHWPAAAALAALLRDRAWAVRRAAGLALRSLGAPGLLYLRRSLHEPDRYAADMARQVLDWPDAAGPVGAV